MKANSQFISLLVVYSLFTQTAYACLPPIDFSSMLSAQEQATIEAKRVEMYGKAIMVSYKGDSKYIIDLKNEAAEKGNRGRYWSRSINEPAKPEYSYGGFWGEISSNLTQFYSLQDSAEVFPFLQNEIPKLPDNPGTSIALYPMSVKEKFVELAKKDNPSCPYVNEIVDISTHWFRFSSQLTEECFLKTRLTGFQSDILPVIQRKGIVGVIWFDAVKTPTVQLVASYDPTKQGKVPSVDELNDVIEKNITNTPRVYGPFEPMGIFVNTSENKQFLDGEKKNIPANDCSYVGYDEKGNWLITYVAIKENCEKNTNVNPCGGEMYTPKPTLLGRTTAIFAEIAKTNIVIVSLLLAVLPGLVLSFSIIWLMRFIKMSKTRESVSAVEGEQRNI